MQNIYFIFLFLIYYHVDISKGGVISNSLNCYAAALFNGLLVWFQLRLFYLEKVWVFFFN
jgi:hypothetical protein